jgi:alpha/beta superfamily hydrolase
LVILAHSHLGHTPGIQASHTGLDFQVQSAIEAFDALKSFYTPSAKIVLVGHSVGSWVCTQVLKARPSDTTDAFFLFPTIAQIRSTPNGRKLSVGIFVP